MARLSMGWALAVLLPFALLGVALLHDRVAVVVAYHITQGPLAQQQEYPSTTPGMGGGYYPYGGPNVQQADDADDGMVGVPQMRMAPPADAEPVDGSPAWSQTPDWTPYQGAPATGGPPAAPQMPTGTWSSPVWPGPTNTIRSTDPDATTPTPTPTMPAPAQPSPAPAQPSPMPMPWRPSPSPSPSPSPEPVMPEPEPDYEYDPEPDNVEEEDGNDAEGGEETLSPTSSGPPGLIRHNDYRARHGAPALEWSETLASTAQTLADKNCAMRGGLRHSVMEDGDMINYGENLARGQPTMDDAVDRWYEEIDEYMAVWEGRQDWYGLESQPDADTPSVWDVSWGHFTQIVWDDSRRLGCAQADDCGVSGDSVFVCHYDPPGNVWKWGDEAGGQGGGGNFKENVKRPLGSDIQVKLPADPSIWEGNPEFVQFPSHDNPNWASGR